MTVNAKKTIVVCPKHEPDGNKNCLRRMSIKIKSLSDDNRINSGSMGVPNKNQKYIKHQLTKLDGMWICENTGDIYHAQRIIEKETTVFETHLERLGTIDLSHMDKPASKGRLRANCPKHDTITYQSCLSRVYYRPSKYRNQLKAMQRVWICDNFSWTKGILYFAENHDSWRNKDTQLTEVCKVVLPYSEQ